MSHTILRLTEVTIKTGLSRSTIYQRMKEGAFPKPISLGDRAIGFISSEVDDWIESKIKQSRSSRCEAIAA